MLLFISQKSFSVSVSHKLNMSTVVRQTMHSETETYFAYLSRSGQIPCAIKTLIDRYDINIYDNAGELYNDCDTEEARLINFSTNNNDDDVDPAVSSPPQMPAGTAAERSPSPNKIVKLKFPSLTRRLSKLGKRSSTDKNKTPVESTSATSPSDSQLTETTSSADMTTVDELKLQSPDTCSALNDKRKSKDQDEQKDKYEEGNRCGRNKKNTIAISLPFTYGR